MSDLPTTLFDRIRFRGRPVANPDSTVIAGRARFTVLTGRLIRLEWSETGEFEDRGTYAFPTREAPPPPYRVTRRGTEVIIDTGSLTIRYHPDGHPFSSRNLSIAFALDGVPHTWVPGAVDPLNLRGTRRTLDGCAGDAALEEGLLSRAGWSLYDDSRSVVFDAADGWVTPRPGHRLQDWYFFGYGHDYKGALAEYVRFGHPIPLIPRFVLGSWWSRYWAYSAQDLHDLVGEFERFGLPLDVLVVDMDWHTPHAWTGYTWNRELFPDPPAFLRWAHDKGLRVTLNLHPAQGVQSFEEVYPRFARAMGVDPATGQAIPFRITDRAFVRAYFELLHHPLEDEGVDFWWVDWQQGETSEMPGLDPLTWLNHLHFMDSTRRTAPSSPWPRRPMLYSRWGGLGNHRYPIGFSGDTYTTWGSLQFQPYLTATAANVAFGWWSHDIGGHMGEPTEPELFARWIQFGALSPVLRLHATKDPLLERRPWKYPEPVYEAAKAAYGLRYRLIPYLYTLARIASDTGLSPCRPMYYEHPQQEAAYAARYQYFLGDQLIAAPIVHPADPATGLAAADVWVPDGTWIDLTTRESHTGPRWVRLVGGLDRLPLLVRAGAILPQAASFEHRPPPALASGTSDAIPRDRLILSIFPGPRGTFRLYEDDGATQAYREGQYEWTQFDMRLSQPTLLELTIGAVEGECPALPRERSYEVRLEGSRSPQRVWVDGAEIGGWTYQAETQTTVVPLPRSDKSRPLSVTVLTPDGVWAPAEELNQRCILADVQRLLGPRAPETRSTDGLLAAVLDGQDPGQADALARLGGPFIQFFEFSTPEEASRGLGRVIVAAPTPPLEPFDVTVRFCLEEGSSRTRYVHRIAAATSDQIVDTPFTFAGLLQPTRWSAQAEVVWRGRTWTRSFDSQVLFPTISAWQGILFAGARRPALRQVMDRRGHPNPSLGWTSFSQVAAGLSSLRQPHVVRLPRRREGRSATCFLATTIVSPAEQGAVLAFRCGGSAALYLNGARLEVVPSSLGQAIHPFFRGGSCSHPLRLRPGPNWLVVRTTPPEESGQPWYFSGGLLTPEGQSLVGLAYQSTISSSVTASLS